MADNAYLSVSTTTNGDTDRILREVATEAFAEIDPERSALTAYRNAKRTRKQKTQKVEAFHSFAPSTFIRVTAAANAAATQITVDDSGQLRTGRVLWDPKTFQQIYVSGEPGSSTTAPVTALSQAIAANSILIVGPTHLPEEWSRLTPEGRATESHEEYCEMIGESGGISFHMKHTGVYGPDEYERLMRQTTNLLKAKINNHLFFAEPNGTAGAYRMAGLHYRGRQYNRHAINGTLRLPDLYDILHEFKRNQTVGESPKITLHCAQKLVNRAVLHPYESGNNVTINQNAGGKATMGYTGLEIANPLNVPLNWMPDTVFDEGRELQQTVIAVNWGMLKAIDWAESLAQLPTAQLPQGVADIGTGTIQWFLAEPVGLFSSWPMGSVILLTGVQNIRP